MSADQLGEAEVDRLGAAVFEQRRLSHMLRQRGVEIEALQAEFDRLQGKLTEVEQDSKGARERLEAELGQAHYEVRRADRRVAKAESASSEAREQSRLQLEALGAEVAKAEQERDKVKAEMAEIVAERERLEAELGQVRYEARRADRRVAKLEAASAEARKRGRLQLDGLALELREGLAARDEALKERQQALQARDEATVAAAESVRGLEETARQLGQAQREVELLTAREREREAVLAALERTLGEVAEHLRRVRASRSWRWGHALAQVFRTLTFRRRSSHSALDAALDRLAAEKASEPARG